MSGAVRTEIAPVQFEGGGWTAVVEDFPKPKPQPRDARRRFEDFLFGPGDQPASSIRNPQGAVFHEGRFFCCDQGLPGVIEIRPDGSVRSFTHFRSAPACPVDLAFDDSGRVFVADTTLREILFYDQKGVKIGNLYPSRNTSSFRPAAVLHHNGTLFVANSAGKCIEKLDISTNQWLDPICKNEKNRSFGMPSGISTSNSGELFVADALFGVVYRMSTEGVIHGVIGKRGRGKGELVRPAQVAVAKGLVLVTDAARQSVVVFDEKGVFLLEIGGPKGDWRGFTLPSGIAVMEGGVEEGVQVVVTDTLGARAFTRITLRKENPD